MFMTVWSLNWTRFNHIFFRVSENQTCLRSRISKTNKLEVFYIYFLKKLKRINKINYYETIHSTANHWHPAILYYFPRFPVNAVLSRFCFFEEIDYWVIIVVDSLLLGALNVWKSQVDRGGVDGWWRRWNDFSWSFARRESFLRENRNPRTYRIAFRVILIELFAFYCWCSWATWATIREREVRVFIVCRRCQECIRECWTSLDSWPNFRWRLFRLLNLSWWLFRFDSFESISKLISDISFFVIVLVFFIWIMKCTVLRVCIWRWWEEI